MPAPRRRRAAAKDELTPASSHVAWREMFLHAKRFRDLAPWRWMADRDIFGVLDAETDQVGWCCVIGMAGEIEGLVLYRGDEGLEFLQRVVSGENVQDEAMFGQEALVLVFADREELSAEERATLRRLALTFRGRGAWPHLESHGRDRLPAQPKEAEIRRMQVALEQVLELAPRVRANSELLEPDSEGRLLVRAPPSTPDGSWRDERRTPASVRAQPIAGFDSKRAETLRRNLAASPAVFELDVFVPKMIIAERGEAPFAPAMFLLAERPSGMLLHAELAHPAGRERWVQDQLMIALERTGSLPRALRIKRPELKRQVAGLAEALGIDLQLVAKLPAVDPARRDFDRTMHRGRPRPRRESGPR